MEAKNQTLFQWNQPGTSAGMKLFKNDTLSHENNQKYNCIPDSITRHLEYGKEQGNKYGWSDDAALIETNPEEHISVYKSPNQSTKTMIMNARMAMQEPVNPQNIQHCICLDIWCSFGTEIPYRESWIQLKKYISKWENKEAEMDQHLCDFSVTTCKEQKAHFITPLEK